MCERVCVGRVYVWGVCVYECGVSTCVQYKHTHTHAHTNTPHPAHTNTHAATPRSSSHTQHTRTHTPHTACVCVCSGVRACKQEVRASVRRVSVAPICTYTRMHGCALTYTHLHACTHACTHARTHARTLAPHTQTRAHEHAHEHTHKHPALITHNFQLLCITLPPIHSALFLSVTGQKLLCSCSSRCWYCSSSQENCRLEFVLQNTFVIHGKMDRKAMITAMIAMTVILATRLIFIAFLGHQLEAQHLQKMSK